MNRIHIIVAIKASNSLFPPLRTVLFSTRGREIAKPSNIPLMYNTRASLDLRKTSLMQKQREAIGDRWNRLEMELFSATRVSNVLLPQLRTNLFSIRSWEIAEPSNVSIDTTMGTSRILTKHAQKYNTDASLDSSPCKKDASNTKKASSYCCVVPSSLIKAIGSAWKWNGFQKS